MNYTTNGLKTTGAVPRFISGASLAQYLRKMTPAQKAVLAANIVDGQVVVQLTAKSVAAICGANASYMFAALHCTPEQREEIARGTRSLVPARTCVPPAPGVVNWDYVDRDALTALVRAIGVDRTLDAAVAAESAT